MILVIMFFLYFSDGNWPTCWIIKMIKILYADVRGCGEWETSECHFFQNWSIQSKDIAIFLFSKWPLPPSFIFKITNCLANSVRGSTHEHVKFWQNRSIGCEDIKIFQFFKMAGDAILDYQICEISLADSVWKAQTHHRAKCRQNWSACSGDIAFFEFSKWPTPPSWIFEIAKFYWLLGRRRSRHISMPNFVKIDQSVGKILRFFRFFKMAAATIFYCQIQKILLADSSRRPQTHHFTKFCQNRSFHCKDVAIFRIFKMAAAAILDF